VLTQPDRKAGRGLEQTAPPVKRSAQALGLAFAQPTLLGDAAGLDRLRALEPEAIVVAAFGRLLPQAVLDIPLHGAINIHASLLPRWRGAAPIHRAILAGDAHTGVCIMQMDAGLDTGPIVSEEAIPIAADDTTGTLAERLAEIGSRLILTALAEIESGQAVPRPQAAEGVTYAVKIQKAEARIDWNKSALEIDRTIRAFNPSPGAVTWLRGAPLKIWGATPAPGMADRPGTIVRIDAAGVVVECGKDALQITDLQRAGGKRLLALEFARGHQLRLGERLGQVPRPD